MLRVALVNMPFAGVHIPSLALTQLKAVLQREFPDDVSTDVLYLSHDVAELLDLELYRTLSDDVVTTVTGFPDWLFRGAAFPELSDNADAYVRRYKHSIRAAGRGVEELLPLREKLAAFLDTLIERYSLDQYSLVGFTTMFDQLAASIAMARRLKVRSQQLITVVGGPAVELSAGAVVARRISAFDFVFSGPALKSFPAFVGSLLRGDLEGCHGIRGVYSSRNVDRLGGTFGGEENIDAWLPLDYDDFLASLRAKCPGVSPELFFETSRGCWWGEKSHCTFCGLNGTTINFRQMAPERAIAQFEYLFSRYPDVLRFFCVDNILDKSYYTTVLPFVRPPKGVSVFYEMKVETDYERLQALSTAGITRVQPGIEALSTSVLKLMGKGTTAFKNIDFLKKAKEIGLDVDWNLLLGFPNEDPSVYEKYLRDIPMLVHLQPPEAAFPVRFDRYSPYHQRPDDFRLDLRPIDFYEFIFPFSESERMEFAYFFSDHNFQNGYMFNLARWQRHVETAVDYWISRWTQSDSGLAPALELSAEADQVLDSRTGEWVRHDVSPLGVSVLRVLDRPMRFERASEQLGVHEEAVVMEIEQLAEQGLLFREGDKFLSLVELSGVRRTIGTGIAGANRELATVEPEPRLRSSATPMAERSGTLR